MSLPNVNYLRMRMRVPLIIGSRCQSDPTKPVQITGPKTGRVRIRPNLWAGQDRHSNPVHPLTGLPNKSCTVPHLSNNRPNSRLIGVPFNLAQAAIIGEKRGENELEKQWRN